MTIRPTPKAQQSTIRAASAPPSVLPGHPGKAMHVFLLLMLFLGGTVGCVVTGFSLPVSAPALLIGIPLLAAYPVLCGVNRRLYLLQLLPPITALSWILLRREPLYEGFSYGAAAVMRYLCSGYPGLTMPHFLSEHEQFFIHAETNTLLLSSIRIPLTEMLLCFALLTGTAWVLLYRTLHCIRFCAILPLPAFVLCFLIIESTIPALWALLMILMYWVLLLFTRSAVRLHSRAAAAQAAFLLLPCVLFLSAVYLWYPRQTPVGDLVQSGYDRVMDAVSTLESSVSDAASGLFSGAVFTVSAEGNEISFDNLTPRRYLGRTVMRAKCDTTGVLYLREKTYGAYTASGWEQASPDRDPFFEMYAELPTLSADILAESGVSESHLSLDGARSSLLFSPYYFSDASIDYHFAGDRHITNTESVTDYDISFYRFSGKFDDLPGTESAAMLQVMVPQYLKIDDGLAYKLRDILSQNGIAAADRVPHYTDYTELGAEILLTTDLDSVWETVAEITYFVRDSAEYSLNADVKTTADDFVVWFLEEAEYGYCTHFATAEVMLLRACGIPARLAAGFLCSIRQADLWTAVKDSNAHAWVEVFDPRLGWVPVEATPPASLSADMNEDNIIVGGAPIPGVSQTETEPVTTETEAPTDTEAPPADTASVTDPAKPHDTQPADTGEDSTQSGIGQGTTGTAAQISPLLRIFGTVLLILVCIAAFILLLLYQRDIRRRKIEALFSSDAHDRNRRVLRIYRRCAALARACGEELPASLTALAEKARFSQHTLTVDELAVFRVWYDDACARLQAQDHALSALRHSWIDLYY